MCACVTCREGEDGEWNATRVASEEGELPELPSEASTYQMQRKLYDIALNASSGGAVATTFSTISPNVAIYQVRCAAPAAHRCAVQAKAKRVA